RAAGSADDLHLEQAETLRPTGAESLEHRLLGREESAEVLDQGLALALEPLARAAEAPLEGLTVTRVEARDARQLDDVDADAEDAHAVGMLTRGRRRSRHQASTSCTHQMRCTRPKPLTAPRNGVDRHQERSRLNGICIAPRSQTGLHGENRRKTPASTQ